MGRQYSILVSGVCAIGYSASWNFIFRALQHFFFGPAEPVALLIVLVTVALGVKGFIAYRTVFLFFVFAAA